MTRRVRLAQELRLDDDVDFPGHLGDAELVALLSTADVCLSPEPSNPLNDASTMIKVVEYMALGKPVVAYDLPETRFSAGDAALYARPSEPGGLAACVERVLDDEDLAGRMGEEGHRRVADELGQARSIEALDLAYRRVLRR